MTSKIKTTIDVFARLKPVLSRKKRLNVQVHCLSSEQETLIITGKINAEYINHKPESYAFQFRKVLDESSDQEEVFNVAAKPVVQRALEGYNGTVFAYGQTGSGKTFTITGLSQEKGIVPRTFSYVFDSIKRNSDETFQVCMSYLEIYNEHGYDLLKRADHFENNEKVILLENEVGEMQLRNLSLHSVDSLDEAMTLFSIGETNRMIEETPMNPISSRSHCILTLYLTGHTPDSPELKHSKLHIIDLAGSERVEKSGIGGHILTEACHINLSLHYLEQVIVALSETNRSHVPYRNSLMTSALRDSLGGNCLTVMIANLASEQDNFEETISTCRFAQRVAMVKNQPKINLERDPQQEIDFLKAEIAKLKDSLASISREKDVYANTILNDEEVNECKMFVTQFLASSECEENDLLYPTDPRKVKKCYQLLKYKTENNLVESDIISVMSVVQDLISFETQKETISDVNTNLGQSLTADEKEKFLKYLYNEKKGCKLEEVQKLMDKIQNEVNNKLKEVLNVQKQILILSGVTSTNVTEDNQKNRFEHKQGLLKKHSENILDYQAEKLKLSEVKLKIKKIYQKNYRRFLNKIATERTETQESVCKDNNAYEDLKLQLFQENIKVDNTENDQEGPTIISDLKYSSFQSNPNVKYIDSISNAVPSDDLSICMSDVSSVYSLDSTMDSVKCDTRRNIPNEVDFIACGSSSKWIKSEKVRRNTVCTKRLNDDGYSTLSHGNVANAVNEKRPNLYCNANLKSLTPPTQQTWSNFQLTGDKEVDEEIINFYKNKSTILTPSFLNS